MTKADAHMSCEHCAKARAGIGCGYRVTPALCLQCVARSVARSLVTHEAVRTRDASALRETLCRVLPMLSYEQSSAMVKAWWLSDQAHRNQTAHPTQAPPRNADQEKKWKTS